MYIFLFTYIKLERQTFLCYDLGSVRMSNTFLNNSTILAPSTAKTT